MLAEVSTQSVLTGWYNMSCKFRRADEIDGTPGLAIDYWRSRRGDDGRKKKRERARCMTIDHSSTKNKIKAYPPIVRNSGVILRKNSGKLLVRRTCLFEVPPHRETAMKPYKLIHILNKLLLV